MVSAGKHFGEVFLQQTMKALADELWKLQCITAFLQISGGGCRSGSRPAAEANGCRGAWLCWLDMTAFCHAWRPTPRSWRPSLNALTSREMARAQDLCCPKGKNEDNQNGPFVGLSLPGAVMWGFLTWTEFSAVLDSPKLQNWLATLELESNDLVNLCLCYDLGLKDIIFPRSIWL